MLIVAFINGIPATPMSRLTVKCCTATYKHADELNVMVVTLTRDW